MTVLTLLDRVLSDRRSALNRENVTASIAIATHTKTGNREPTKDNHIFLTVPRTAVTMLQLLQLVYVRTGQSGC